MGVFCVLEVAVEVEEFELGVSSIGLGVGDELGDELGDGDGLGDELADELGGFNAGETWMGFFEAKFVGFDFEETILFDFSVLIYGIA